MATSPIYNWPEPDNTDLVKNGALAMRTLGDAIDTTMATMVPQTIVDAKGDLIAGTAADTAARLAVGNNGETLVADSSTSTGLRYTAGTVQANPVLNSAFQVWQRGTSFAVTGYPYTADRWQVIRGGVVAGMTISRQLTGDTTNLPFIQYAARMQRDSGDTSTQYLEMNQFIETLNSIPFAGKTITFSFYARKGANFSATSDIFNYSLFTGTGTDQNLITTGFTGNVQAISTNATLTTTWQRFQTTATLASNATEIGLRFRYSPTGTAGANDYVDLTGVQIDIGSVALPFRTYAATIQGELAACQRYYWRSVATTAYAYLGNGQAQSTTATSIQVNNPVPLRVGALTVDWANIGITDAISIQSAVTSLTVSQVNTTTNAVTTDGSSGLTQYRPYFLSNQNNVAGYIGFGAEL